MKRNRILQKLRRQNRGQYRMLTFCIFLSVLLISSFSLMYYGPTVQNFLAKGGDTRKMATLLLGISAVGCGVFTLYASSLFFRYKSREYGIFLALGEQKRLLKRMLFGELASIAAAATVCGLLAAIPVSWLLWCFFESFLVATKEMSYQFGFAGFFVGIGYAAVLCLLLGMAARRFVKHSDIMDILKTQHKSEMVKEVKPWTCPAGMALILTGLLAALALPSISANVFHQRLPGITNLFYLLCLAGVYLVLLNVVAQNRLSRNKKKFYKNMVSISMMRFYALSTTRNMCVIVILLFACIFAGFYGSIYADTTGLYDMTNSKPYAMHFPSEENQLSFSEILETANRHGVTIRDYGEVTAPNLVMTYTKRDLTDDGQYIAVECPLDKTSLFFSEEMYGLLTGRAIEVETGSYMTITPTDYKENIWDFIDGLREVTNPVTGRTMPLNNAGSMEYDALAAMNTPYTYVISNEDFAVLTEGITERWTEKVILFNTDHYKDTYFFAQDLLEQYVARTTALSNHLYLYDPWEEQRYKEKGEEYTLAQTLDLSMDNALLLNDWKYAPSFTVITSERFMEMFCVYIMLCLYIFIITLTAAGIMTYVRSVSIASDNRDLFDHLKKLGASQKYQKNILKKQLMKIFQYPAVLGCTIGYLFCIFFCWFNDSRFTDGEFRMLGFLLLINAFILLVLYVVYRFAKNKAEKIAGITT